MAQKLSYCLILLCALSACLKQVHHTGHALDEKKLALVTIGESSRDDVFRALGSPSAKSEYGEEVWYYITSEYEQLAFLNPKVISQSIASFTFNKDGNVSKIDHYSAEDAKEIQLSRDKTRTSGHKMGILEQLLGNIGRFNANQ